MTLRELRHAFEAAGCDSLGGVLRAETRNLHIATKPQIHVGGHGDACVGRGCERCRNRCVDDANGTRERAATEFEQRPGAAGGLAVDRCRRHRSASFGRVVGLRGLAGVTLVQGKHVSPTGVKEVSDDWQDFLPEVPDTGVTCHS